MLRVTLFDEEHLNRVVTLEIGDPDDATLDKAERNFPGLFRRYAAFESGSHNHKAAKQSVEVHVVLDDVVVANTKGFFLVNDLSLAGAKRKSERNHHCQDEKFLDHRLSPLPFSVFWL